MQRIFDLKRVLLCKDKFCVNCQHLKQARLLKRFTPVLEELNEKYSLYHVTFTVKNVSGDQLKQTIGAMFAAYKKIHRYFSGDAKLVVPLSQYGYVGSVRCLEIVTNATDYHPHIHSLFVLRKDLDLPKCIVNKFSYDNGILTRKFSELEILIQKIFYLLVNKQKVTQKNIDALPIGYSCVMREVEADNGSWKEVFKYVTKLSKDGTTFLTYEQFKTLYNALYRCKVMQGYGVLYSVAKNRSDDDEADELYEDILAKLCALETPEACFYEIEKLVNELRLDNFTAISKRQIYALLHQDEEEDDE